MVLGQRPARQYGLGSIMSRPASEVRQGICMRRSGERGSVAQRKALNGSILGVALAFVIVLGSRAQEADWPTRTVTVIVGISAGGSTDLMARIASKKLSESLNQTFVIENRVGGGGIAAAMHVARAAPDGYTLFFAAAPHMAVVPR